MYLCIVGNSRNFGVLLTDPILDLVRVSRIALSRNCMSFYPTAAQAWPSLAYLTSILAPSLSSS